MNRIIGLLDGWMPEDGKLEGGSVTVPVHASRGFDAGTVTVELRQGTPHSGERYTEITVHAPRMLGDGSSGSSDLPVTIALFSPDALRALTCALVELMADRDAMKLLERVEPYPEPRGRR